MMSTCMYTANCVGMSAHGLHQRGIADYEITAPRSVQCRYLPHSCIIHLFMGVCVSRAAQAET